ncbi:MAG: hypothetical protein AAGD07_11280, partial [Planctomycetota bacterium]
MIQAATNRHSQNTTVSSVASFRSKGQEVEETSPAAIERAIDFLFSAPMSAVAPLMRSAGLVPKSTVAQRREQVVSALESDELRPEVLGAWLDAVEGWGNHQVLFLEGNRNTGAAWRRSKGAIERLDEISENDPGVWSRVEAPRPLWPTERPELFRIDHRKSLLSVSWAQSRTYLERAH